MIIVFQILFSVFAILTIVSVLSKKKNNLLGVKAIFFWVLFWVLATGLVWWPNSLTILANKFGIGRGADLVLYTSLAVIFYILFRLNVKLESIGRDMTKIVREKALK